MPAGGIYCRLKDANLLEARSADLCSIPPPIPPKRSNMPGYGPPTVKSTVYVSQIHGIYTVTSIAIDNTL